MNYILSRLLQLYAYELNSKVTEFENQLKEVFSLSAGKEHWPSKVHFIKVNMETTEFLKYVDIFWNKKYAKVHMDAPFFIETTINEEGKREEFLTLIKFLESLPGVEMPAMSEEVAAWLKKQYKQSATEK